MQQGELYGRGDLLPPAPSGSTVAREADAAALPSSGTSVVGKTCVEGSAAPPCGRPKTSACPPSPQSRDRGSVACPSQSPEGFSGDGAPPAGSVFDSRRSPSTPPRLLTQNVLQSPPVPRAVKRGNGSGFGAQGRSRSVLENLASTAELPRVLYSMGFRKIFPTRIAGRIVSE